MHRTILQNFGLATVLALAGTQVACGPDYPHCDHDNDCHTGEFCVDGQCQQCRNNNDCTTGQQCTGGRCEAIPGYCDAANACPSGQECVNSRCQAVSTPQCDDSHPCPTGQECQGGYCNAIPGYCDDAHPCPSGRCENNRCQEQCQLQPVYFEFDSATLDDHSRDALRTNATCANGEHGGSMHATGHADPRGTEEYNLALGQHRADAVKRYLRSLGVHNVSASSRGEEDATGTDESSWTNDRRVDFPTQ